MIEIDRLRPRNCIVEVGDVSDGIRKAGVWRPIGRADPGIRPGTRLIPRKSGRLERLTDLPESDDTRHQAIEQAATGPHGCDEWGA